MSVLTFGSCLFSSGGLFGLLGLGSFLVLRGSLSLSLGGGLLVLLTGGGVFLRGNHGVCGAFQWVVVFR